MFSQAARAARVLARASDRPTDGGPAVLGTAPSSWTPTRSMAVSRRQPVFALRERPMRLTNQRLAAQTVVVQRIGGNPSIGYEDRSG